MSMVYVAYVIGAKLGRSDDFGELVLLFQARLLSYVRTFVRDADDAEEVAQESFVAAWERIGELKRAEAFPGWLWRIARNRALAYLTAKGRLSERVATEASVGEWGDPRDYASNGTGEWERITAALSPERRVLVELRYAAGFSLREIGAICGVSESRVKSRLYETRQYLLRNYPAHSKISTRETKTPAGFKERIMDKIESERLGAEILERLSLLDQLSFAQAAVANRPFAETTLAAVGKLTRGKEFFALYGQRIGLPELIKIMNCVDRYTEKRIIEELDRVDPECAESIKRRMFVFEDFVLFDREAIRLFVAAIDRDVFATALSGSDRATRTHLLGALDDPTREGLLALVSQADAGPERAKAAQEEVIRRVAELEKQGRLRVLRQDERNDAVIGVVAR
jgi:RNA polymerase sigma-70 factor, ECF subfamily